MGYENKVKPTSKDYRKSRFAPSDSDIRIIERRSKVGTNEERPDHKRVEHKVFPSYVLIKMVMTDETWRIRNIRGVTGFVGWIENQCRFPTKRSGHRRRNARRHVTMMSAT